MAQTIREREYLFRPRPRRTRPALAIMLLGVMSLVAAGVTDGVAEEDDRRTASSVTANAAPGLVYGAVGGPERFVLETRGTDASIRFLCLPSEASCAQAPAAPLRATSADGATILRDQSGHPVLTIASRGVRLHAGSEIVPGSVPAKGRAVLPTNAKA